VQVHAALLELRVPGERRHDAGVNGEVRLLLRAGGGAPLLELDLEPELGEVSLFVSDNPRKAEHGTATVRGDLLAGHDDANVLYVPRRGDVDGGSAATPRYRPLETGARYSEDPGCALTQEGHASVYPYPMYLIGLLVYSTGISAVNPGL